MACSQDLDAAYGKLDYTKTKGYNAKLNWAKAEGLLAEARVGQGIKEYNTCIAKAKAAAPYIQASLQ
ncbi:MAG TPA: hypothetical protein DEP35_05060 [Deltaproteobacteria bacterium]|jgi:hypothetical protein|nr:hypothetical protein [Deltaproteobacteria bacterium]